MVTVFPAYAGMSRRRRAPRNDRRSFPRLRGDEPAIDAEVDELIEFSPPTRG